MNRLNTVGAALGLMLLVACGAEPGEPEVKFAQGKQLLEEGAYEEAQAYFEEEIASTPEDPDAYYFAGQAAAMGANYGPAEAHFMKALELNPETADYYDWLGRIYGARARVGTPFEQMQAARQIKENFEKAVELDPDNLEAKFYLGTFYILAPPIAGGDRAKAKAFADELLTAAPLSGQRLLAQYHLAQRNPEEAEKAFQEALALAPEEAQSHSDLAAFYLSQGEIEKAGEHLDKALELDPDHQASLLVYGELASKSDDHLDKGIASLEKLIGMDMDIQSPNPGNVRYVLGMLYEKQGRQDEAVAMYEAAVERNSQSAKKRLSELQAPEEPAEAADADEATTTTEAVEPAPAAEDAASTETPEDAPAEAEE